MFATLQQYRDYTGDQGAELTPRELANASRFIGSATMGAVYDVNDQGAATESIVITALRDATCELLACRAPDRARAADVDSDAAKLRAAGVKRASVNGASYELADGVAQAQDGAGTGMPLDVHLILVEAGLVGGPVCVVG